MPEMPALSGKSKVPVLSSQGSSYAKWGRWVGAFSCFPLPPMRAWLEQPHGRRRQRVGDQCRGRRCLSKALEVQWEEHY